MLLVAGALLLLLLFVSLVVVYYKLFLTHKWLPKHVKHDPEYFKQKQSEEIAYDVIIVGAGPSGSTAAYYLSTVKDVLEGRPLKVALLERKSFPRVKYCGDAWCEPALQILSEMGILEEIEKQELCRPVQRGEALF